MKFSFGQLVQKMKFSTEKMLEQKMKWKFSPQAAIGKVPFKSLDCTLSKTVSPPNLQRLTGLWPFRKKQRSGDAHHHTLLIITDAALAVLTSANVVLPTQGLSLIHWDLPTGGRKAFERRFCLLRSAIPNIHFQPEVTKFETKVHLLLRPHNASSLYTIMDFLRRSNAKVPEELEVFHSGAMFAREKRQQLCSKLVQVKP